MAFLSSLLIIIMIDLVLAGDNAIVIAMAARNLPKDKQKKVIIYGMIGAVIIRILATLIAVRLLSLPWLMLVGGVLLTWIAYKLLVQEEKKEIEAKNSVGAAIGTIILADMTMGLDNVLAVAGAAGGNQWLVIIGLLISIPIIVWGSTLFIRLIERYPVIIYFGAGILAFTAGKMLVEDKVFASFFSEHIVLKWIIVASVIAIVIIAGKLKEASERKKIRRNLPANSTNPPSL